MKHVLRAALVLLILGSVAKPASADWLLTPYVGVVFGGSANNFNVNDLFDNLSNNELGVNVGGGVHVFFSDNVGLRGDVRYFRGLQKGDDGGQDLDLEDFDFWRSTVGLTFRFGS